MPTMSIFKRLTDRKRGAIIEAATAEFRANGFDATSMDRIAARACASKRTVYNHFPSKEELFAETLLQMWEGSRTQRELPYRADHPLRQQLLTLLRLKMQMLNEQNFVDLARVALSESLHAPERVRALVERLNEREEPFSAWVRAAQAAGRLKPGDAQFAVNVLMGLLKTFAFWPQITTGQPPLTEAEQATVVDSTADIFLASYGVTTA